MTIQGYPKSQNASSNDINEHKAAIMIQKVFRGSLVRKSFLPSHLLPVYRAQCKRIDEDWFSTIPRAKHGNTKVYLPNQTPQIVVKSSGKEKAIERFHHMQKVREILNQQNLIIPKANICNRFLVEERLPIHPCFFENMSIYLSNLELFNEAVKEMTRLFSQIYLDDLISPHFGLGNMEGVGDMIRYDNLPLFIREKKGKLEGVIGLIDLEQVQYKQSCIGLETLVRIFPYHVDLIMEEAKNLDMIASKENLISMAEKGKKYLHAGFTAHLNWLKKRSISNKYDKQNFAISSERINEISTRVQWELLKLNKGINNIASVKGYRAPINFLIDPEPTAESLAPPITSLVIKNLIDNIKKKQDKYFKDFAKDNFTDAQLIQLRSPVLKRSKLRAGIERFIQQNKQFDLDKNSYESLHARRVIVENLVDSVMRELVGNEIFLYDPSYKFFDSYNIVWVRY